MELGFSQDLGEKNVEIIVPEGTDVLGLLSGMVEIWGDSLAPHIFKSGTNQLLPYVCVVIKRQNAGFIKGFDTSLEDGDEVLLSHIEDEEKGNTYR